MSGLIAFPAPAKLNLMLRVVGRRDDGYHLLQTVFRFIGHGDEVRLRVRRDGVIARLRPVAGVAEYEELTVRAARALRRGAPAARARQSRRPRIKSGVTAQDEGLVDLDLG